MRNVARVGTIAVLFATSLSGQSRPSTTATTGSCDALAASLSSPTVKVTSATTVAAGAFAPPGAGAAGGRGGGFGKLSSFCRVAATLTPSADSDIKIEIWLPETGWNGKLQSVGNGGWAGTISYPALATAVAAGFAAASTDTGHATPGGSFALGHPEKLVDYAYRAVHEMTVTAKMAVAKYYGRNPSLSYWNGCSMGGRQALKEAQQFPNDYDGIIAGAPAANWTGRAAQSMRIGHAIHTNDSSYIPPAKYPAIHAAAVQACDLNDGVKDGVIEDPIRCKFDPAVLECKGADSVNCLTAPQVDAAKKIYSAAVDTQTGREIFPGLEPGSELGWATWGGAQPFSIGVDHFRYVVMKDPTWDFRNLKDSDLALAQNQDNNLINALDPNLKAFFARGGKIIQYHGWADPQISPRSSVRYYEDVLKTMGGSAKVEESYRLFMVPGMAHCGGGEGPNSFDMVSAIQNWVEQRKAPEQIVASRITNDAVTRTRPLCPYPQVAKYKGTGSTDEAANFSCAAPTK